MAYGLACIFKTFVYYHVRMWLHCQSILVTNAIRFALQWPLCIICMASGYICGE